MSRKPKKGYFVRGQFVAEGSEQDLQLKAEMKHFQDNSRTELKRESTELQKLGEQLITLRKGLFERLALPEKLVDALAEADRITNFEGKRRQMQFVGKLMRGLDDEQLAAVRAALADVDRHAQRLVAVAFHVLQLTLAHRHREAAALGGFGAGIGGTELFRMRQRAVDELFEAVPAVREALS